MTVADWCWACATTRATFTRVIIITVIPRIPCDQTSSSAPTEEDASDHLQQAVQKTPQHKTGQPITWIFNQLRVLNIDFYFCLADDVKKLVHSLILHYGYLEKGDSF